MPKRTSAPEPIRVTVDSDTSMPAMLAEVRKHVGQHVLLVVPDDAPVLLTVAEFRALKDTADRSGVDLVLQSNSSLRTKLASMMGVRLASAPAQRDSGWRPPDTMLATNRAYETWGDNGDDADPVRQRKRRRTPEPDNAPRGSRQTEDRGALDYIEDDRPSAIGATARRVGQILAVVLTLALVASLAAWYALPNVTIVAMVDTVTVESEVLYAVAEDGANMPSDIEFVAPAESMEADVPFTISVPTTGVQRTPQETARGQVLLRNPTAEAVTVPAGSTLSIHSGMTYTTDSEVSVPAASNNVAGEATVEVTAAEPGSVGNAEQGMLTGIIEGTRIHFSNRDAAIEGGTDNEVAVVDEADLVTWNDTLVNEHSRAAAEGWNDELAADGKAVVVPSVVTDLPTIAPTAQPGDQAEEVSASGTVHATGLVYDTSVVEEQTRAFFAESLQAQVPAGYRIDPETVQLSEPLALASAPNNVQFRVTGTAQAHAEISDQQVADLRNTLAGSSWDEAHATLDSVENFESYELEISPGWWFKRMPKDGGRIEIEIADAAQSLADTTPEATVED